MPRLGECISDAAFDIARASSPPCGRLLAVLQCAAGEEPPRLPKRREPVALGFDACVSAVDHGASRGVQTEVALRYAGQRVEVVWLVRGGGFDLHGLYGPETALDEEVDLVLIAVAPERELRRPAFRIEGLERLVDDGGLEQRPVLRARHQLFWAVDAYEVAGETRVKEVELRCLDEPLSRIRVIGLEQVDDVARLEYREPVARRLRVNAAVSTT